MPSNSQQIVLVSGASGFLGGHIVNTLLAKGYSVRGLARGSKAAHLKNFYADKGSRFEVIEIADILSDQFPEAFKGVYALIHAASALPGNASLEDILKIAIDGTKNILNQAYTAGVKKVVVTGSIAAVFNPAGGFSHTDWNPLTKEDALASGQTLNVYSAAKKYAELAVWEFAENHPDVDVTTFVPPILYGSVPSALKHQLEFESPNYAPLSTAAYISQLLWKEGSYPAFNVWANVEDIAKLHVAAISSSVPSGTEVGNKRIVVSSPTPMDWKKAKDLIATERPQLKDRLIEKEASEVAGYPSFDFERIDKFFGMKEADFTSMEKCILDTVDDLIAVETKWKDAGHEVKAPGPIA